MGEIDMNSAYKNLIPKVESSLHDTTYKADTSVKDKNTNQKKKINLPASLEFSPHIQNENMNILSPLNNIYETNSYYRTPVHKQKNLEHASQKLGSNKMFVGT